MTSLVPRQPTALDSTTGDVIPKWRTFDLVGTTGLRRSSGYVDEEFLPALKGRKGIKIYREMWDNSAVLGGWFAAVSQLLRQIEWPVEPGGGSSEGKKAAKFLESCMGDMEHSWGDMITEIASFGIYGWNLSELLFKRRMGPWEESPIRQSKYTDGMIGLRAVAQRSQETMQRWMFDDDGNVLAMVQQAPPRYDIRVIPLGKCLLFRTTTAKNNPEGRSLIRSAYQSWYYLKRFQEIEAIGVARDLAGMPVAKVPPKLLQASPGSDDAMMLDGIKKMVTSVHRNETEGILWPWEPDEKGVSQYEFELMTSGGSRQFDTESIINRYKTEMLQAVVSDWLQVGHENTGTYNMHTDKTGLFRTMINALAQMIADQFNRRAIPLLFKLNNWRPSELPTIVPNNVDPPDLTALGGFLQQTAALGVQWFPDPTLEKFVRDAAGLPAMDREQIALATQSAAQQRILALAQQRLEAIQTDQQAAQGEMSLQQGAMGLQQQAGELEAGPEQQDPNAAAQGKQQTAQSREKTSQAKIGTKVQAVKLAQEKAKLAQLKAGGGRSNPANSTGSRGKIPANRGNSRTKAGSKR